MPARNLVHRSVFVLSFLVASSLAALAGSEFVNFETPPGQPIAVSEDGSKVYAVNTPDNRLAVLDAATLALLAEIPVGLEPTSVLGRPGSDEVWVTNALSDSLSVVSLSAGYVIATIAVGDEPMGLAFTPDGAKAYVTVSGDDAVAVVEASTRRVLRWISLPARDPRALAMSPDGDTLYVASYTSGNRTRGVQGRLGRPGTVIVDPALPDEDLFAIRTSDDSIIGSAEHLGTLITAVRVSPDGRRLYAANMEARNTLMGEEQLRGIAIDNRLAVLDASSLALVSLLDLDGANPSPATANAEPADIAFDADGSKVYIASAGSGVVQVLDRDGNRLARLNVGVGARGLAFNPARGELYVLNRLRQEVRVISTASDTLVGGALLGFDPTPETIRRGRRFLYSANLSGTGKFSCGGCHAGGHLDDLVWDLGTEADPKGAMATQSLRGLANLAPYHWRGDRPDLESFNLAFDSLMGGQPLGRRNMRLFADFIESIVYPPNPGQAPDRSLSLRAQEGLEVYQTPGTTGTASCISCHILETESGAPAFGSDAQVLADPGDPRLSMKTPQLRGLADKSSYRHDGSAATLLQLFSESPFTMSREQIDDLNAFLMEFEAETMPSTGVQRTLNASTCSDGETLATLELLMDRAARKIRPGEESSEIELQANGLFPLPSADGTRLASLLYRPSLDPPAYEADWRQDRTYRFEDLRQLACEGHADLTFTAVPEGTGVRALDRDMDGLQGGDEVLVHGTDPSNPDTDGDGLTDHDEVMIHLTDPLLSDSDGDTVSDEQEAEDGTDPNDPASVIVLSLLVDDASAAVLTWTTETGARYRVEIADLPVGSLSLRANPPWELLHTSALEDESPVGTESLTDGEALAPGMVRNYLVRVAH